MDRAQLQSLDFDHFSHHLFGERTPPNFSLVMVTGSKVRFLMKEAEMYFEKLGRDIDQAVLLYFLGDYLQWVASKIPDNEEEAA